VVRGTGLSGKFVNAYIDELIKRGFVSEKEGMLSWVDDNDSKGEA
jgi:predicted transcriptional regulator